MTPGKSGMTVEAEEVCLNLELRFVPLLLTRYKWLGRQRSAHVLPILLLATIGLSLFALTGCSLERAPAEPPPMTLEVESLVANTQEPAVPRTIRILESRWGTRRSGDFLQLHVVLDEQAEYVPVQIALVSHTDADKVLKMLPLELNPDFTCGDGAISGFATTGQSYDTEPLLTRRSIYQPFRKLQLPKATSLTSFDVLVRDQDGREILITGIKVSGLCLSIFE